LQQCSGQVDLETDRLGAGAVTFTINKRIGIERPANIQER
jgi:hypothetical protein